VTAAAMTKQKAKLTAYLDSLRGAAPDMAVLRDLGVALYEAIRICTNHRPASEPTPERHQLPKKAPAKPFKPAEPAPAFQLLPLAPQELPPPPKIVGIVGMDKPAIAAPRPVQPPVEPIIKAPEPLSPEQAASMTHTLSAMVDSLYACPTELHRNGFSASTAREIALVLNTARKF
jgi:hypothetical protein